ncbi:MAG: hypothetical protein ACTHL8_18945 [Burkholderiaceae bacterium]
MTSLPAKRWHWRAVDEARAPRAVVGFDLAAVRLRARVAAADAATCAQWAAVAAPGMLVVLGPSVSLPWAEGVRYAAPHPDEPALWLPTHVEPAVPVDLLWRALERIHGRAPLLLWPEPAKAIPLDRQLPVDEGLLKAIQLAWGKAAA